MTPVEINTCNRPNDNHEKDKDKHSSFTTFLLVVIFAALPTMVANYGIYKKKFNKCGPQSSHWDWLILHRIIVNCRVQQCTQSFLHSNASC